LSNEPSEICGTYRENRNTCRILIENLMGRNKFEDLGGEENIKNLTGCET
jgi:hypothetical protein